MQKEIGAIVLLVVAILVLINAIEFYKKNIEQADARKFVIEELKTKYPLADIEIVNVNEKSSSNNGKYFEIKTKVTQNAASPCPERMHIYFNYPEQNFVSQPPEYITKDCKICIEKTNCPILFEEEAIIASHTISGSEEVHAYINNNKGTVPAVTEGDKLWVVTWDSPLSTYYYEVTISKSASLIKIEKKAKASD